MEKVGLSRLLKSAKDVCDDDDLRCEDFHGKIVELREALAEHDRNRAMDIDLFDFYAAHAMKSITNIMEEAPGIADCAWEIAFEMLKRREKWIRKMRGLKSESKSR